MDNPSTGSGSTFIHFDAERIVFCLSEGDLEKFRSAAYNLWKDCFMLCFPLGIAGILNGIAGTKKPFDLTLSLFLNYLIGGISLLLSIVFFIAWMLSKANLKNLIDQIKKRPKYLMKMNQTGGGETPVLEIEAVAAP